MRLQSLALEMTTNGYEFSTEWIREHGWKVVPVEDGNHFAPQDIAALVPAMKKAGYSECFAVASEPLGDLSACYRLLITEEDFRNFNAECGLFRYIVMDEARSWAISCNEWYNLFAADPALLEARASFVGYIKKDSIPPINSFSRKIRALAPQSHQI